MTIPSKIPPGVSGSLIAAFTDSARGTLRSLSIALAAAAMVVLGAPDRAGPSQLRAADRPGMRRLP